MTTTEQTAFDLLREALEAPNAQHPDDIAVDKFAAAMKAKMAKQRAKGYSGWDDKEDCPTERLQQMLADHIAKGDAVDVGNFAMMLWNLGEGTAAPKALAPLTDKEDWDIRGILASKLRVFHRTTEAEADELISLFASMKSRTPLTQPEVVEAFCNTRHNTQYVSVFDAGVRFAEKHHGIGGTP